MLVTFLINPMVLSQTFITSTSVEFANRSSCEKALSSTISHYSASKGGAVLADGVCVEAGDSLPGKSS